MNSASPRRLTWLCFLCALVASPPGALAEELVAPAVSPPVATEPDPGAAPDRTAATAAPASDAPTSATPAPTEPAATPTAAPDDEHLLRLHSGLNLRTDVGVHPIRLDVGAQWSGLDMLLVLDPMFFLDSQMSTDLIAQWRSDLGVALFGGWRLTTIPLLEGAQFQHNLLLGAGAELPRWFGGLLGGQVGLELASVLLKHGGGIPAETISFASGRHYIDLVNLALFLRLELGWQP